MRAPDDRPAPRARARTSRRAHVGREPLTLYLVRHAIAEERGPAWPDDTHRPLTPSGASRMRQAARGLKRLGVQVDRILSSPLVRARQTAEILREVLDGPPALEIADWLAPGLGTRRSLRELGTVGRTGGQVALVGHEPDLGHLAARLIGATAAVPFKKGAVCCVELEAGAAPAAGRLAWFLPPRVLRQVTAATRG